MIYTTESLRNIFKSNSRAYYCLVAGLPELGVAMPEQAMELSLIREEISTEVHPDDAKTLEILYNLYDVANIVNAIQGNDMPHNALGTLSAEDVQAEIEAPMVDEMPFVSKLPASLSAVIDRYKERVEMDEESEPVALEQLENQLWLNYYNTAAMSSSKFIRVWSAVDRQMRNIVAASKARMLGVDPVQVMVGGGEVEEQIISSTAADFGLRGEFDYIEQLMDVIGTSDLVSREHKMDNLRWSIVGDLTDQNYFDVDFLGAYMVKLNILERWRALDKKVGGERFGRMVESFTRDVRL